MQLQWDLDSHRGHLQLLPARSLLFSLDCGFPDFSTGLVLEMVGTSQLELCLAQLSAVPYNHRLTFSLHPASSWLLLERGESCWQRLFTLWLSWQGKQLFKGQSCVPQPELGLCPVFRLPGPGTRSGRRGREGDGGKEAEQESCVALSAADVYCTGWAGWEGGRLEWGPVPPAARPQGAGVGTFNVEGSRVRGSEAHTHTHTHTCTHPHTRTHNTRTGTWYTR